MHDFLPLDPPGFSGQDPPDFLILDPRAISSDGPTGVTKRWLHIDVSARDLLGNLVEAFFQACLAAKTTTPLEPFPVRSGLGSRAARRRTAIGFSLPSPDVARKEIINWLCQLALGTCFAVPTKMLEPHRRNFPKLCMVGLANLRLLAPQRARGGVGGAERQQVMLAKALRRRGFDISMVVYDEGQPDGCAWDGITTYAAYRARAGFPGLRFIYPRWTGLWSALKRADADIYYLSCASMQLGVATLFARRYERKVVFRVASDMDCDQRLPFLGDWRHKALYLYGLRHADAVLAQTRKQQGMLARLGRSSTVAAPLSDLSVCGRDRNARDLGVLWVNNLRESKRADLLLELARSLPSVRFDMVGGPIIGHETSFKRTQRAAASLPNVRFHGFVPYEQTAALYARAQLLVSTSEIEGFPNTYLQAWASGTPVIAFFDPDETIARNQLGYVARTLEDMQLVTARLLTNDVEWAETSVRCRAYAASVMDESSMLMPYVKTFMSLWNPAAPAAVFQ
jgi:glycosyltransferase involved in cell wall biosynthesis